MSTNEGDIGELAFMLEAKKRGLKILSPYSGSSEYDVAIDNGKKIYRVQVKTTSTNSGNKVKCYKNAYHSNMNRGRNGIYTKKQTDFVVVYICPLEIFYIFPVEEVTVTSVNVYPKNSKHRFHKYLNNWDLLTA